MKEKVQYCFVSENKNACQEGEAWGVIYIIKPNLSQLTYYPEFTIWTRLGGLLLEVVAYR